MWSSKKYLLSAISLMPLLVCMPYAFFASDNKLLFWVWHNGYWPFWAMFSLAIAVPILTAIALFRLKKIIYWLYVTVAVASFTHATYLAMSQKKHFLLLIVFLQGALFLAISEWILYVLRKPYFDSRRAWWEGRPKPIPQAKVKIYFSEKEEEATLTNIGEGGCFVFSKKGPFSSKPKEISIYIQDGRSIRGQVKVARYTRDRLGMGLYFIPPAAQGDWYKELDDMMENMRRFGYVSR